MVFKLPENKRTEAVDVPRTFLIWGKNMSGKSFLADHFPNALTLSTDKNPAKKGVPHVKIKNIYDANGNLKQNAIDQVDDVLSALKNTKHPYETVILDQIEGILGRFETAITSASGVEALADIPYGKGYAMNKSAIRKLMETLDDLDMNVVFISHEGTVTDPQTQEETPMPMLSDKQYAQVAKSVDLEIQTKVVGKKFIRRVVKKRTNYNRDHIQDKTVLKVLDAVTGVFDKTQQTTKTEQQEIVKKIESEKKEEGK